MTTVNERVADSFQRQGFMTTMGARLLFAHEGEVRIDLPFASGISQQHGFAHGGAIASVLDSACGYAALSLQAADTEVVTVEFKINFLNPARGERFVAIGRVVKPGRTVSVCTGEVIAYAGTQEKTVAVMQATMMAVPGASR